MNPAAPDPMFGAFPNQNSQNQQNQQMQSMQNSMMMQSMQMNQMAQMNQMTQMNQMNQMNQLNQMNQMNQINQMRRMSNLSSLPNMMPQMSQMPQMNSMGMNSASMSSLPLQLQQMQSISPQMSNGNMMGNQSMMMNNPSQYGFSGTNQARMMNQINPQMSAAPMMQMPGQINMANSMGFNSYMVQQPPQQTKPPKPKKQQQQQQPSQPPQPQTPQTPQTPQPGSQPASQPPKPPKPQQKRRQAKSGRKPNNVTQNNSSNSLFASSIPNMMAPQMQPLQQPTTPQTSMLSPTSSQPQFSQFSADQIASLSQSQQAPFPNSPLQGQSQNQVQQYGSMSGMPIGMNPMNPMNMSMNMSMPNIPTMNMAMNATMMQQQQLQQPQTPGTPKTPISTPMQTTPPPSTPSSIQIVSPPLSQGPVTTPPATPPIPLTPITAPILSAQNLPVPLTMSQQQLQQSQQSSNPQTPKSATTGISIVSSPASSSVPIPSEQQQQQSPSLIHMPNIPNFGGIGSISELPLESFHFTSSLDQLKQEDKQDLFFSLFDCNKEKQKEDNRKVFQSFFTKYIAPYSANADKMIAFLIDQFRANTDIYQYLKEPSLPMVFVRKKRAKPVYRILTSLTATNGHFVLEIPTKVRKDSNVQIIGQFYCATEKLSTLPIVSIDNKTILRPLSFGESSCEYYRISETVRGPSRINITIHLNSSERSNENGEIETDKSAIFSMPLLTFFIIQYVVRVSDFDIVKSVCKVTGVPKLAASLQPEQARLVVAQTPNCRQECSFDLIGAVEMIIKNGSACCPICESPIIVKDLKLNVLQQQLQAAQQNQNQTMQELNLQQQQQTQQQSSQAQKQHRHHMSKKQKQMQLAANMMMQMTASAPSLMNFQNQQQQSQSSLLLPQSQIPIDNVQQQQQQQQQIQVQVQQSQPNNLQMMQQIQQDEHPEIIFDKEEIEARQIYQDQLAVFRKPNGDLFPSITSVFFESNGLDSIVDREKIGKADYKLNDMDDFVNFFFSFEK